MIIIEVEKGIVADIYADNPGIDKILVVDIDGARVGDVNIITDVQLKDMDEGRKSFAKRVKWGQLTKEQYNEIFRGK